MTARDRAGPRRHRGLGLVMAVACVLVVGGAGPALADAAGPTDYRNDVLGIEPPGNGVHFSIVGGDSFVRVEVEPGRDLVVLGYFGEPYLHFLPDGTVLENSHSPAADLNVNRYGEGAVYDRADADLPPAWSEIGDGGTWAWHDHRIHWMSRTAPPGRNPGDIVYDDVRIPIRVDGTDAFVTMSLTWVPRPFPLWPIVGASLGLGLVLAGRSRRPMSLAVIGLLALVVGLWQYLTLPPETSPSPLQWAVPGVALAFLGIGLRRASVMGAAVAVAAVELAGWGIWRRESMWKALLPTGAPPALDRLATAACLAGGVVALALFIADLRHPGRTEAPEGSV